MCLCRTPQIFGIAVFGLATALLLVPALLSYIGPPSLSNLMGTRQGHGHPAEAGADKGVEMRNSQTADSDMGRDDDLESGDPKKGWGGTQTMESVSPEEQRSSPHRGSSSSSLSSGLSAVEV